MLVFLTRPRLIIMARPLTVPGWELNPEPLSLETNTLVNEL